MITAPGRKKTQYPNIGIYTVFHSGKKFIKNEPFRDNHKRESIVKRLIAWKNKNRGSIKTFILYVHHSEGNQEEIYRDPRSFRLWLKFPPDFAYLASSKSSGTSTISRPAPTAENDYTIIQELVQKSAVHIWKNQLWQARIYNPENQMVFEWNNQDGEKSGNWLEFTQAIATIND